MNIDESYTKPTDHISDELRRIDLILAYAIQRQREMREYSNETFSGLYISEKEIDAFFERDKDTCKKSSQMKDLLHSIEVQRSLIEKKLSNTRQTGIMLPLERLQNVFGLSLYEREILLLCLALNSDAKYEKIYAYLHDDATKRYLTLQLIFTLLTNTLEERALIRQSFSTHSPLIKWQLLKLIEDHRDPAVSSLSKPICIDERIIDFLLGSPFLDSSTAEILHIAQDKEDIDTLYIGDDIKQKIKNITKNLNEFGEAESNTIVLLYGPDGYGKRNASTAVSSALNIPLLEVSVKHLLKNEDTFKETIKRIIREALMLQCSLLIKDMEVLLCEGEKTGYLRDFLLKEVGDYSWLTFLSCEEDARLRFENESDKVRYIKVHFPVPDFPVRKMIWEKTLNGNINIETNLTHNDLANKFRFTERQIKGAVSTAIDRAFLNSEKQETLTEEDVLTGCRAQCNHKLTELARKITPKYKWDDIVLPDIQISQLQEICTHLKYKHMVYGDWGFETRLSIGKGLNVLFAGPSGTGKTMAAEIMANELMLELYKIDLSQVVSKYIGETEKNLSKIFHEAETSNAILFFDEADALFGKRSEVKDAHDRYANIEVGYLLQKMEEYEGITILATNLKKNIDEAFVRRMRFIVDFPAPDEKQREQIWKIIFPAATPVSEEIDYVYLSERLEITGGNIKNIALSAAFYAAGESSNINMRHTMLAAKRELQKMGKLCMKEDFGEYYELMSEMGET
ncbi:MAG: ATP-binding protein [Deltaproteobacteria bacterium]|nr:ATP-binding protein [Deltaproteobacteria bacterium]